MTHLNDISKIYLEQIAEKKDDSYLETDMKKRQKNNEKAIADMKKVKDDTVPRWMKEGKKLDPVGQEDADIDNDGDVDKSDKYLHKKRKAIGKAISKKKGEDEEVEQIDELRITKLADKSKVKERAKNIKSIRDKKAELAYLMKHYKGMKTGVYNSYEPEGEMVDEKIDVRKQSSKRKSLGRGSSINPDAKKTGYESPAEFRKTEKKLAPYMEAKNVHGEVEVPSGNIGKLAKKASKRIDTDVDGDVEHNDKHKGEYGEFVPTPDGKKKVFTGPKKVTKESFSNWRQDLIEVADEDGEKQIKEMPKNQKNKISINPKLGEAVEGIGGTLLEEVEIDELDVIINTIYDEFLEEGYTEDEIEEAFEVVLLDEATVTYGHDSRGLEPKKQSKLQGRMRYIKRKVGEKLSAAKTKAKEKYGMASAKAQVAAYNKARELSQKGSDVKNRAKTSLKRFVKRQAQKVVDRMSEEVEQIDEKAVSKKQQRFMGMVYAAKKGEAPASAEVAKAAAGMSKKDAKDFASTKHKKLPEVKESMQGEVQMSPQEVQLQRKSAQIDKKLASIRQRKVQKQTSQQGQKTEG